jgi:ATP-dependent DNA ligase
MEYGTWGGFSTTVKTEDVEDGKASRSRKEQIMSRMASRISKQRDKGYVPDFAQAEASSAVNAINMPKPMLAQPFDKVKDISGDIYMQYKYDGNRCLIAKKDGEVFAYSRNGKLITSIDHILEQCKDIPEGTILDGELYCHGVPLQTLRSWISKNQAESNNLVYMLYDMVINQPFYKRLEAIKNLKLSYPIKEVFYKLLPPLELDFKLPLELEKAIKNGYEGLILRHSNAPYETGKRSKSLVKVKQWLDKEFIVEDISASADGWAILHLLSDNGKPFKVSAPGTIADKEKALLQKESFIGQEVTVQYACLTKDSIPFHPIAVAWRFGD